MRKTLLIALAGMMMFAFTQCGETKENKNQNEGNQENTETQASNAKETKDAVAFTQCDGGDEKKIEGSAEFVAKATAYQDFAKKVAEAADCNAITKLEGELKTAVEKVYDKAEDKMKDTEKLDTYKKAFDDALAAAKKAKGCQ